MENTTCICAQDLESQCLWAALDQEFHGPDAARVGEAGGTSAVLERVHARTHSLPFVRATAPQLRFGHLLGYAARYYSYLAARAAAFRLWTDIFEREPYDRCARLLVLRAIAESMNDLLLQ